MRGTNLYNIARSAAHKEGIKIAVKSQYDIRGYRVSEGFDGYNVELMSFDESNMTWTMYDMDYDYKTLRAAKESAKDQLKYMRL